MSIPHVKSQHELDDFLKCEALVLYFTATWCGPCQAIAPLMEQLYSQYTTVEIAKVDLDSQRAIASHYQITAVPTFVFLHGGKEINRVKGASTQAVHQGLKDLSVLAPQGKRRTKEVYVVSSEQVQLEKRFVPKGFRILNPCVMFAEFEALNVAHDMETVKSIVKLDVESQIKSDADSQLLFHIPFSNVCKVSSILIKSTSGQRPNLCKIWANRHRIMSFDDIDMDALHQEDIETYDDDGCYEIKLKFVRFQKVTSLDLFFDGEDEDESTVVDKIVVIGIDGEPKNQAKIENIDNEY
jgi:thiol-disulfide isomerase/thioredoxin